MPKCEQCGAELQEAEGDGPLCAFCQLDADDAERLQAEADSHFTAFEEPLALEDVEDATVMFDTEADSTTERPSSLAPSGEAAHEGEEGNDFAPQHSPADSRQADTAVEMDLSDGDEDHDRPTLHGGPEEDKPMTEGGAASLTRFDQITPAPPSDSGAAATIELERKIEKMWAGVESESSSPSATLRVSASHLEDDTHLSVSERPIAYPEAQPGDKADYRVMGFIAQGGMGRVYKAQQTSLGRQVAIKTLKDDLSKKDRHRRKFFAEASITGRLDHPNIVPIYDLGVRADGVPFYSMKFVTGEPWDKVIEEKSKPENVNILLRVCDAMAFAHSKQILHRDLKPENVMLGEYGEVLVADWGLAIHMQRDREFSLGGTPLYMSPEMANHDVPLIGVRSDVYLLGAILFEILEGKPPHASTGKTATERLLVAAMNQIEPHESTDELIEVALKALSTNPSDRYDTVKDFQAAIVECQRHADSRDRSQRAASELKEAKQTGETEKYARALFAFQDAIDLWPENHAAREGLQATRIAYAKNALKERDYALGLSLLDPADPEHQAIHKQLLEAQKEEQSRGRRLKLARRVAVGATAATLGVLLVSAFLINNKRQEAVASAEEARQQRTLAEKRQGEAEAARDEADKANQNLAKSNEALIESEGELKQSLADLEVAKAEVEETLGKLEETNEDLAKETERANTSAEIAKRNAAEAQQRAFNAKVALIAADLAVYDTENASANLAELKSQYGEFLDWEADRLRFLTHADFGDRPLPGRSIATSYSPDGQSFAALVESGSTIELALGGYDQAKSGAGALPVLTSVPVQVQSPRRLAFSKRGEIAVGGGAAKGDALVEIYRPDGTLAGSIASPDGSWEVSALAFSPDAARLAVAHHSPEKVQIQILSLQGDGAQLDGEVNTADEVNLMGVGYFSELAFSADGRYLAAIERDNGEAGTRIRSWTFTSDGRRYANGSFNVPATSLAFDPKNPRRLACGCAGGPLLLCEINPNNGDESAKSEDDMLAEANRVGGRVVEQFDRHIDDITQVAFSPDGDRLATASRSGTALVWSRQGDSWAVDERPPVRHNSPLIGCVWAEGGETLLTSSTNGKLRAWPLDDYRDVRRFTPPGNPNITTINTTRDEAYVAVGARDGHVWLYDTSARGRRPVGDYFIGHRGPQVDHVWSVGPEPTEIISLDFNPQSASDGGEATVVDWSKPRRKEYIGLESTAIDLTSSGDYFALFDFKTIRLVSRESGEVVAENGLAARSLAALPSDDRVVVGYSRGGIAVLQRRGGELERASDENLASTASIRHLATTRWNDADIVYAASDATRPEIYRMQIAPSGQIEQVSSLSPISDDASANRAMKQLVCDGPWVAAIVGVDNELFVLGPDQNDWTQVANSGIQQVAIDRSGVIAAVTSDGRLLTGSAEGTATLVESLAGVAGIEQVGRLANGNFYAAGSRQARPVIHVWRPGDDPRSGAGLESRSPVALAWPLASAAGEPQVATLSEEGAYRVWDASNPATPVSTTQAAPSRHRILQAASSAGHNQIGLIASDGAATLARVLDTQSGEWRTLPLPPGESLSDLANIAVADEHLIVWDAATQTCFDWRLGSASAPASVWRNDTPTDAPALAPQPVAVSAQGKIAVVTSDEPGEEALRIFAPQGGALVETHRESPVAAISLAFSQSGQRLLAGGATGQVVVYDASASQPGGNGKPLPLEKLTAFSTHRRPVRSLRFSPTGRTLLTAADQGEAFFWPSAPVPNTNTAANH